MSSVLFPRTSHSRTPKLHVSAGSLPPYIDPREPPTKRSPWRQINETPFVKTVTITMPTALHNQIWSKIEDEGKSDSQNGHQLTRPRHAKVLMKLEDILTGDFFNTYIKIGNILMISEGIPGVDSTTATLRDGILKLEVSKDIYQRCGIQGQPVKNHGARKHIKERFAIELNLRLPSMVRGRKGFDRLLYAARNVLNETRIWLFCDLMPGLMAGQHRNDRDQDRDRDQGQDSVLAKYHPTIVTDGPCVSEVESVVVPRIISRSQQSNTVLPVQDHEYYYEMVEWLDLVNLGSVRVRTDDKPDPYISRYAPPPDAAISVAGDDDSSSGRAAETLLTLKWKGLISSTWVTLLLINLVKQARAAKSEQWLAVTVKSHPTVALGDVDGYTVLLRPSAESSEYGNVEDQMEIDRSTQAMSEPVGMSRNSLRDIHCFQFVDTLTG